MKPRKQNDPILHWDWTLTYCLDVVTFKFIRMSTLPWLITASKRCDLKHFIAASISSNYEDKKDECRAEISTLNPCVRFGDIRWFGEKTKQSCNHFNNEWIILCGLGCTVLLNWFIEKTIYCNFSPGMNYQAYSETKTNYFETNLKPVCHLRMGWIAMV